MAEKFKAIPTDFMGIRFRSKSEAMFANMLEQRGKKWCYEPSFLKAGDYTPDFIYVDSYRNGLKVNVIEYKPGKPTKAYLERVMSKAKDISNKIGVFPKSFSIISINFFEPFNVKRVAIDSWKWVEVEDHGFTEEMFNRVRSYRYDLDQTTEILPEQKVCDRLTESNAKVFKPAINTTIVTIEENRVECERGISVSRESVSALEAWVESLRLIKDILADYAALAIAIEIVDQNTWNVVFPPGSTKVKEMCNDTGRKSILERNIGFHSGKSIKLEFSVGESEWASRFLRLQNVFSYIKSKDKYLCRFIYNLHDHKGDLTCTWSLRPSGVYENGRKTVELAWESVGEIACNVSHKYAN